MKLIGVKIKPMKASIIIPVYNVEKTLRKCVESLVFGRENNVEILLIDDCSKDNSWQLCEELACQYPIVKCFRNSENKGVSYTRNQGLEMASGDYIMFVDSDDWVSGQYVRELIGAAQQSPNALIVCGFHFCDKTNNFRKDYIWKENGNKVYCIHKDDFFVIQQKVHLQQLWNKVFRRDLIEVENIRFDESQSMGEDFQFVLDYIQAAKIQECIIINHALYYYIRANQSSLMSKFGMLENEKEFQRLKQLRDICGADNPLIEIEYNKAIQTLKINYIYRICRNSKKKRCEKIELIEKITNDGNAKLYFREQQKIIFKEKIIQLLDNYKTLWVRASGRIQRYKRNIIIKQSYKKLLVHDFSIISQNCIGGVFYHDMNMKFLSPTINLFFKEPDFIRFVQNLEYYINTELRMTWGEEYPIGYLDDIPVFFMHYHTCYEAKESWNKRKQRINWNKIIVLATDMEGFDEYAWKLWSKISYPKVLFTVSEQKERGVVSFPQYKKNGHVIDLIPDRKFYKDNILIETINDSY